MVIVPLIVLAIAWYFGARSAALLSERLGVETLSSKGPSQIGWNGTYLLVDSQMLDLGAPDNSQALQLTIDAQHRLVASLNGKTIALGQANGAMPDSQEPVPAFAVAPGERATFTRMQGWLIWPNWFETNFMTGNSPSWKRFVYYRLVWHTSSGATLNLFWRFEQWYYPSIIAGSRLA